jgi:hypothetical protein
VSEYVNVEPEGLGAAGAALWAKFVPAFVFEAREEAVLVLACRQQDDIATLEAALADEGAVVTGSRGQQRVNGALAELRQARLAQARLLGSLKLPEEDDDKPRDAKSKRAQHAAHARWSRTADLRASRKNPGQEAS